MKLTFEQLSQMMAAAVIESDEAVRNYSDAMRRVEMAKEAKVLLYGENSQGLKSIVRPIDKMMKELLDSADVPASAMPGGKATGGNADERKAARLAWVRKNSAQYREYEDILNTAEFQEQLATGAAKVAELAADAARAKVDSYGYFALYFAKQMENETERLRTRTAIVTSSTPRDEETARGRQMSSDYEPHFGDERGRQSERVHVTEDQAISHDSHVTRTPQAVDDSMF